MIAARRSARFLLACSLVLSSTFTSWAQEAAPPAPPAEAAPAPDAAQPAPDAAPPAPAPDAAPPAPDAAPPQPAPGPDGAQPAPAPAEGAPAPAAQQEIPAELLSAVENYWHYGKIARYDLAAAEAQKIVAAKDQPVPVLLAFEKIAKDRKDNIDEWLLRFQGTEQLKEATSQIIGIVNAGRRTRRSDPAAIQANVDRLNTPRGYALAIRELRESGELAVPIMIDYLRNPNKAEYHGVVRNALRDLGRPALNPLVAVTESKNQELLIPVTSVLGDLGYPAAVPYLAQLANSNQRPAAVRAAAATALTRMGAGDPRSLNVGELFFELAEKFYYDAADIQADTRDPENPANVWFWNENNGLVRKQVPQAIFNEIMSMRSAEYSLKNGGASGDPQSLWLAGNYKREAELPQGATDPTRAENQPSAHFYGVNSGAAYLNNALARALRDRNPQVALPVIKSLQEIIGRTNLFSGQQQGTGGAPALIDAMASTDRLVRYESAFAVAAAIPQQQFQGQERVIPLLAEAMSQTGQPSVIVVMPSQDRANNGVDEFRKAGYAAVGATTAEGAVAAANELPAVDVILVTEEMGAVAVDQLLALSSQNSKVAGAAKVVIVRSGASPYTARALQEPLLSVTQAQDFAGLKSAADQARAKAASLPIDQTSASNYALRAADLLERQAFAQAVSQQGVLNLAAAEQTVLSALNDARPDVVKAAGEVLGYLNSQPAQAAILQKVLDEKTADDVKVSLLKSGAVHGKFFGNRLSPQQVQALDKLVETSPSQDVKNAAGEFRGSLNLPADQAKTLILNQSKV